MWKGETAAPPGNVNPEGSITALTMEAVDDPGLDANRDSAERSATTVVVADGGVTIQTPGDAGVHVLWNNMYAPLYEDEG